MPYIILLVPSYSVSPYYFICLFLKQTVKSGTEILLPVDEVIFYAILSYIIIFFGFKRRIYNSGNKAEIKTVPIPTNK